MLLIGLGHRARQGKNTAALAMLDAVPLASVTRLYAFADALRMEVTKAVAKWGGPFAFVEAWKAAGLMPDWVHADTVGKQRGILQWWGTDYRRAQDPDYWVKRLFKTLKAHEPDVAFITDVRFPNEADAIKAAGGYLVKVTRLSKPDVNVQEHASEAALDGYANWDYTIEADTLDTLKREAKAVYQMIDSIVRRNAVSGL